MNEGTGGLRVGDAEREAALSDLGEHYAVGRLSADEYDDRAAALGSARTWADLEAPFADLPDPRPRRPWAPESRRPMVGRPQPGGLARLRRLPLPARVALVVAGVFVLLHLLPVLMLGAVGYAVYLWVGHPSGWRARAGGPGQASGRPRPSRGSWR